MTLSEIEALYIARGGRQYAGEAVTQLEHALQSAQLAAESGASDELITACLLHDLGHMSNDKGETPTLRGVDDRHQYHGVSELKRLFGPAVLNPILLHVDAKRYLCATDEGYWQSLSVDSKRSLELQGGTYNAEDAAKFIAQPHARDAVKLRRWDDLAKVAGKKTPDLAHFLEIAARCMA
ncbi:MAG TPA: HD domain-containing protein [Burkholderiales bacterium]|jgi:phosphonate degradation associated HDIG domain protein|nr:HD domain-containing protein [Burkholderiales bacterium]